MKYRILALIVIFILLLGINVTASNYEYNISTSNEFISAQNGNNLDAVAQKLNMTTEELNSFFNKNGLLYLAVSDDAKTQIRLSAFTDNFSSAAIDIANLEQNQLNEFKNSVSGDNNTSFFTQTSDGRKFIAVKNTLQDSGGVYTVTQYITICDSKTFYLSCYNEGTDTSNEVQSIFESFKLNYIEKEPENFNALSLLILVGIIAFICLALIMLIGIIKLKIKESKETND